MEDRRRRTGLLPSGITTTERARLAGRASQAKKTPEERKESARHAFLAGAVKAVVERVDELTPEQISALRAALEGK